MKKNILGIVLFTSAVTSTFPSFANDQVGLYAGIGAGQSKVSNWISKNDAVDILGAAGDAVGIVSFSGTVTSNSDSTGTPLKIFGGYNFNENFAVEAAYVDFGEVTAKSTATGVFSLDEVNFFSGTFGINAKGAASAVTLDAVGLLKSKSHFDLFGKVGLYNAHSKLKLTVIATDSTGAYSSSDSISDSDTNIHAAIGANAWFTPNIGARIEWEIFKNVKVADVDSNISTLTASVIYHF